MVLMRKDVLYECVKTKVMKRKEDPYAFFTPSLRMRKFNFSCCERYSWNATRHYTLEKKLNLYHVLHASIRVLFLELRNLDQKWTAAT